MQLPESTAEVAFIGRSNVGKSAALCALCDNKKLAVVSKTPGRTRALNVFEVVRGKWLVDLPGYGFAKGPVKLMAYLPKMIGDYMKNRPHLKQVYLLLDAERGVGEIDVSFLKWARENKVPCMIVGSKVDRIGRSRQLDYRTRMANYFNLGPDDIHWISSKKKYGIKALQTAVLKALEI